MSTHKSHQLEGDVLKGTFQGVAFPNPAILYIALYTVAPTESIAGTEVIGGSYARVPIDADNTEWTFTAGSGATPASMTNTNDIVFDPATADWGDVIGVAIWDHITNTTLSNRKYWGTMTGKTINDGNTFRILAGRLTITEN